ncbi:unnamed protein product [Pleuronectes platessa]|uniref:Uncharacterized protein n=1 Tax=Pleuronectes platessa TaxID=8262 RepID=A0A9N7TSX1_PLEPL|nr:unnamed protein product [Pleuronectes platessa]
MGLGHGNKQTFPSPAHLPPARCCAPTLDSRRNPVRTQPGVTRSRAGSRAVCGRLWVRGGAPAGGCCFLRAPANRNWSVHLPGKSQPAELDKQPQVRLRANSATNFCSSRLDDPSAPGKQRHLSAAELAAVD